MIRRALFGLALSCAFAAPAMAQMFPSPFEGTEQDKAACRPDVMKYCKPALPDQFRVLGCLQANRGKLTGACRQVLANYGQ